MQSFTGTPDINIMPRRLMDKKKADDLLTIMRDMEEVDEALTKNFSYRGGSHIVGSFIIILKPGGDPDVVIKRLKPVLEQTMVFGYDIRLGRFVKPKPTLKDYLTGRESHKKA